MKRLISTLLCGLLSVSMLAGCGAPSSGDSTGTTESGSAVSSTENGDTPTIVMAYMNWTGSPAGVQRIEGLISDYTREKIGVNVKLEIMDAASYKQNLTLMLSSGEQVDIFNALSIGYTPSVNKGYCLDLEENDLISKYGSGILSTMDKTYVDACRIGGKLYGLPNQRDMAIGMWGVAIGKEYLDGIGYDYASMYKNEGDEVIYTDLNEISNIYKQLHAKYPDKYVISPQEATLTQGPKVDAIGGDNFGVLLDPENTLKVEDLFSSTQFYDLCKQFYEWNQAGYISKDALTDDTAATSAVKAGSSMSYATATKPGIKQQESNLCGRDMIIFQCGDDFMKSSSVAAMPWCINSGTQYPEKTMEFLNLLYTDEKLSNLLCWGEEAKEYKKTDDGHITFADGVTAETSEYYNNVNWEMPNQFLANIWEGDSLDIWDRMKAFNTNSKKSKALGFSFDNSAVASEYTALTNVYNEYGKTLFYGFTDPDKGIPEFVSKLKEAGLDEYMAAKQEALDTWAKDSGVK